MAVVALRDIPAGEELTYDYQFSSDEDRPCLCGAELCRGFLRAETKEDARKRKVCVCVCVVGLVCALA